MFTNTTLHYHASTNILGELANAINTLWLKKHVLLRRDTRSHLRWQVILHELWYQLVRTIGSLVDCKKEEMAQSWLLCYHLHEGPHLGLLGTSEVVITCIENSEQDLNRIFASQIPTDRQGIISMRTRQLLPQFICLMFEQYLHLFFHS